MRLPRFVRETVERRSGARTLVIGTHEADACLTAYDGGHRRALFAEEERRRLREEEGGGSPAHAARARRAFGLTQEAGYDEAGRVLLPPMMRRLGRIEDLALFVGTGGAVEIWNPRLAADSDDPALRALARWRLGEAEPSHNQEERP